MKLHSYPKGPLGQSFPGLIKIISPLSDAGSFSTPVWSPRGDLIAFAYYEYGISYLGIMKPDGSCKRLIDTGDLIESPSWTTNGRIITYTKYTRRYVQESKSKFKLVPDICSIDLTGHHKRIIKRNASDPYWINL